MKLFCQIFVSFVYSLGGFLNTSTNIYLSNAENYLKNCKRSSSLLRALRTPCKPSSSLLTALRTPCSMKISDRLVHVLAYMLVCVYVLAYMLECVYAYMPVCLYTLPKGFIMTHKILF